MKNTFNCKLHISKKHPQSRKVFYLDTILILIIMFILLGSCNKPSASQYGRVSGNIALSESEDHSYVKVSIYHAFDAPAEINEIRALYPNLAFKVKNEIFFDHRDRQALDTVFTDVNGRFSFKKLPYGNYVLVYSKAGWGYNSFFDININQDEIDLSHSQKLVLFPEIELPIFINQSYILESGKCYVVKNNVSIGELGEIVFEGNTRLFLDDNIKIDIYGGISCPAGEERAFITSYAGIYDGVSPNNSFGEGINYHGTGSQWRNLSFSFLQNALITSATDCLIEKMTFMNCFFGLLVQNGTNSITKNCLFFTNHFNNTAAYSSYNVDNNALIDNIFLNNYMGAQYKINTQSIVENNVFWGNERGFSNQLQSICTISHNLLEGNGIGIENSGQSNLDISYNSIKGSIGIKTYHNARLYNGIEMGWTKANYNNILANETAVNSLARYRIDPEGPYPLDFCDNYWGTTDSNIIDDLIIDYLDLGLEAPEQSVYARVDYLPFLMSVVRTAGIVMH